MGHAFAGSALQRYGAYIPSALHPWAGSPDWRRTRPRWKAACVRHAARERPRGLPWGSTSWGHARRVRRSQACHAHRCSSCNGACHFSCSTPATLLLHPEPAQPAESARGGRKQPAAKWRGVDALQLELHNPPHHDSNNDLPEEKRAPYTLGTRKRARRHAHRRGSKPARRFC